ncbi:MAG: 23S rRNA (uracil(1939)-C(5))-methyltransferase RlmD, partial [Gammaproteobacteria bacterium]|nr:23S rRNA (uracil(1939)-C(5))-methyltransferase RlmD [Gammaproteobacteria bacterium]
MARKRRSRQRPEPAIVRIEAMSHEGRGIASINGKTTFVFGALKNELVKIQIQKTSRKYDQATTLEVLEPSPERISAKCEAFERCGGCSLQHISNDNQINFKHNMLIEMADHAGLDASEIMPPLRANSWGYRRKARLGVKYVRKKSRVLVGFRERNAPFLADMRQCEVLIPEVGHRLTELAELVASLQARESIPQIEVAADDTNTQLVFRHLEPLSEGDRDRLIQYARQSGLWIRLQPGGPHTVSSLYPEHQVLYFLPESGGDIRIDFRAVDFVQVNNEINQKMVAQALNLLELNSEDRVLDLFCGLGNFTLPMARRCQSVIGVEGDEMMVDRARENALKHQIKNTDYFVADLSQVDFDRPWMTQTFDKILFDPPRSGAAELAGVIDRFKAERIVYVSCQPSSLVRDSRIICDNGYKLEKLGVMDMFPQTAHVESMALFVRK